MWRHLFTVIYLSVTADLPVISAGHMKSKISERKLSHLNSSNFLQKSVSLKRFLFKIKLEEAFRSSWITERLSMMSPHTCVCFQHAGGIIPSLSLMADVWVFFFFKMPTQISVVFRISKLIFFPLLLVFGCFVGVLLLFWGCVFFFKAGLWINQAVRCSRSEIFYMLRGMLVMA